MNHDVSNAPTEEPLEVNRPADRKPPQVWPIMAILALYWGFRFAADQFDLSTLMVFVTQMAAHLLLLVSFLIWWFASRRIRLADRFLAPVVVAIGAVAVSPFCDSTLAAFPLALLGVPCILTVWAAWTFVARKASPAAQRAGFCVVVFLTWGFFTLVRWDGIDGRQRSDLHWRWTPSAEELFLAEQSKSRADHPEPQESASSKQPPASAPGDWSEFRGPNRDGIVFDCRINDDWKSRAPQLIWRQRIGPSWSTFSIAGERLFTQEQRGEFEAVVCYDAATGAERWAHQDPVRFYEGLSGAGPRATPTFAGGRIYALGGRGNLNCLDATSGKAIWSHDIAADAKAEVPTWGFSSSPLVLDGLVVVYAGGKEQGLLAYHAETGEPAWSVACGAASYSSPQRAIFGGVPQILMASDQSLRAVKPETGELLWEYPMGQEMTMPEIQPHVLGENQLVIQAGTGLKLLEISQRDGKWSIDERWNSKALRPSFNEFMVLDGNAYGFDEGIFGCLDLETGKRRWKRGRYAHGQAVLLAEQQLLVVLSETGEAVLLAADPKQLKELGRFQAIEGKCWNYPLVAGGRLYVRNGEEAACYDIAEPKAR